MDKHISVPFDSSVSTTLKAGDYVYLTGIIYTARDAAHKRMYEALERGEKLPFDVKNLLYGTVTCAGGQAYRFGRSYNCEQNGQVCTVTS